MNSKQWRINRVSSVMGAMIEGIDLNKPLSSADAQALQGLVWEHQLLVMKNQNLSVAAHEALAHSFGSLRQPLLEQRVPSSSYLQKVVKNKADEYNFGGAWHTDGSFLETPPLATIIQSIEVPSKGGDTLFANCVSAYDSLSIGMKMLLSDLYAIHQAHGIVDPANFVAEIGTEPQAALEEVSHAVVCQHFNTQKKYLYVNTTFTKRFSGMTLEESRGLLDFLTQQIQKPSNTYRHQWDRGDVLIWDNRTTQHCAVNDYAGQRRVMHRAVVLGSS